MDRQSIERRDFPLTRRGYDPAAVEAHLAAVADAFEAARKETRASSAAEQVREIVGAAEHSAEEIRRDAAEQARGHVATVARAAERMLERIREMEADMTALIESVRAAEEPAPNGVRADDEEAARLVALDMALNGTSRDDARRYLDEQFELADADGLLDDVYARAGGS